MMMDFIQIINAWIDWASDPANSNLVRTTVALIAVPSGLVGIYTFYKIIRGKHTDARVGNTAQVESGKSSNPGARAVVARSRGTTCKNALTIPPTKYSIECEPDHSEFLPPAVENPLSTIGNMFRRRTR
jgi:hypothetical protein